ncbi:MAG: hypothetical protein HY610_00145, partial [Elusimicrobia bacterium]|nr:hypothetical protein [Elusimicrobiota bacterium]
MTVMDDGFGNRTATTTEQKYVILNGQAKMKSVKTHTDITNIDGSYTVAKGSVDSVVTYNYWGEKDAEGNEIAVDGLTANRSDRKVGTLAKVVNTRPGSVAMDDGFGNRTVSTTNQTYMILNGQAKVKTVTSGTKIENIDGSFSERTADTRDSVVTYTYWGEKDQEGFEIEIDGNRSNTTDRRVGMLARAENTQSGVTVMNDGYGSKTTSTTNQTYILLNGAAKVKTVSSGTKIDNIDGSHSELTPESEESEVTYTYWGEKNASGAEIEVGGKKSNTTDRRVGMLARAENTRAGVTVMNDGFGNKTTSTTEQTYTIVNGQAKVKTVSTGTSIDNLDGSRSVDTAETKKSVVTYSYWGEKDENGNEIPIDGKTSDTGGGKVGSLGKAVNTQAGVTVMKDFFENVTISTSKQNYDIINGQAKVKTASSGTKIVNVDGSKSVDSESQDSVITYTYGKRTEIRDGKKVRLNGVLTGAVQSQEGITVVKDAFGNKTISKTSQTYTIVLGQAKVETVSSRTDVENVDGSYSVKEDGVYSVVKYTYGVDADGRVGVLIGAENIVAGVSVMDDGFGNRTTSTTEQTYKIVNGQAKVKTVSTRTDIVNLDGSHSVAEGSAASVLTYSYWGEKDENGREILIDGKMSNRDNRRVGLLGKALNTQSGVTVMDDGFGNRTTTKTTQEYDIKLGQAKVVSSKSES